MINDRLFIDLKNHVDLQEFDLLHPEICRGIATATHLAVNGLQQINDGSINPTGQGYKVKPLYEVYSLWDTLPDTDPLKAAGKDLNYNQLTAYLKFALGGYDLYSLYKILDADFQDNGIGEINEHFPNLVNWILNFETSGIFESLHSATLMTLEAGGLPWEHCDPEPAVVGEIAEFIHIKTDSDRSFYMIDPITKTRVYLNHTRVAWWDETDWHGGEPINRPTYTLRINGKFSNDFKKRILANV
jgi:hypothetical protein